MQNNTNNNIVPSNVKEFLANQIKHNLVNRTAVNASPPPKPKDKFSTLDKIVAKLGAKPLNKTEVDPAKVVIGVNNQNYSNYVPNTSGTMQQPNNINNLSEGTNQQKRHFSITDHIDHIDDVINDDDNKLSSELNYLVETYYTFIEHLDDTISSLNNKLSNDYNELIDFYKDLSNNQEINQLKNDIDKHIKIFFDKVNEFNNIDVSTFSKMTALPSLFNTLEEISIRAKEISVLYDEIFKAVNKYKTFLIDNRSNLESAIRNKKVEDSMSKINANDANDISRWF